LEKLQKKTVGYVAGPDYRYLEDLQCIQKMSIIYPYNLDYCGKERCRPGHSFGPYTRKRFTIHMVCSGGGWYKTGSGQFHLTAGQAFCIFPDEETSYEADYENPWEYMWLGFHGYQCEDVVTKMGFSREMPVIYFDHCQALMAEIDQILAARELTFKNQLIRESSMLMIFALLTNEKEDMMDVLKKEYTDVLYVRFVVEQIAQQYRKKIKISQLANEIGISRTYMTSLFKKKLGMSPQEFLIQFRLEKAASMLRETPMPINAIAIDVGYMDSLAFSKVFKRKYGMSPSEYREVKPELVCLKHKDDYKREYPL